MDKKQWIALCIMFIVFGIATMITGSIALAQDDPYPFIRVYGYLATLWAIVAITCFICGWLEKEEEV